MGEFWASKELASINGQLRSKTSELRATSDQLLALVTQEAGDAKDSALKAQTFAKESGSAAAKAQDKADKASASAQRARRDAHNAQQDAAQLRTNVEEAKLNLAASTSGHAFRPVLFSWLRRSKPAKVEIICTDRAGTETKMFANDLNLALKNFGWSAPLSVCQYVSPWSDLSDKVIIFNKWVSIGVWTARPYSNVEADPDSLIENIKVAAKGISNEDAERLAVLALALGAKLVKEPNFDNDSLRILIGETQ